MSNSIAILKTATSRQPLIANNLIMPNVGMSHILAGSATTSAITAAFYAKQYSSTLSPTTPITFTPAAVTTEPSVAASTVVGAISGMVGISAVYPIDVVKTRLQAAAVGSSTSTSAWQTFKSILKSEAGVRALYKGLGPQLCGTGPDKAISLGTRSAVSRRFSDPTSLPAVVTSAAAAGAAQSTVMNPIEIIKVRMQLGGTSVPAILRELGPRGIFSGYGACLPRDVMFSMIYFTLYEVGKARVLQRDDDSTGRLNLPVSLAIGTAAGIPAAFATTPLDVLKTRMQASTSNTSLKSHVKKIYEQKGASGFFSGAGPRVARIAPQFGIVLVTYDYLTNIIIL